MPTSEWVTFLDLADSSISSLDFLRVTARLYSARLVWTPMLHEALSAPDIKQFIEDGFCTLHGAFTAAQAAAASECVWRRMREKAAIVRSDPATWPSAYDIEEQLNAPEVLACFNDRVAAAVEQLTGLGRWWGDRRWGFWPVNFSHGANVPYAFPTLGWHVDGNWFRHTIDCPKQGLLVIGLFTDIMPRWGGTILALGSHKATARVLARHPEGLSHLELFREVLSRPIGNFHEVTGQAGDVVFAHPFIFHTRGYKHGGPPRIISNTEAGLREPMNLSRANPADYSVLERSILHALEEEPETPGDACLCRF